jgi:hypothetical protein
MSKSPTPSSEVTFTAESESSSSSAAPLEFESSSSSAAAAAPEFESSSSSAAAAAPGSGAIAITGGATITIEGASPVDVSGHIQQMTDIKLANGPALFSVISTDDATTISYEGQAIIGKYVQVEAPLAGGQADSTEEASVSLTGDNSATFTAAAASEESAE